MRDYNGQLLQGDWEPIISAEEWEAVRAILQDPARYKYERGDTPKYLLSGMVLRQLPRRAVSPDVKAVLVKVTVLPQQGSSPAVHPEKIVAEWKV